MVFAIVCLIDDVPASRRQGSFLYGCLSSRWSEDFYILGDPGVVRDAADPMVDMYRNLSYIPSCIVIRMYAQQSNVCSGRCNFMRNKKHLVKMLRN